jgi:spermidine/putrescine transport system substrate-binding protein
VPTNYTISTYAKLGLIDTLDMSKLPNYSAATETARFTAEGVIDGTTYAVPKNWGTTGIAVNSTKIKTPVTSWKDFFEIAQGEGDTRVMVHDYQLTTIGNALVSLGDSFNSIKPEELAKAEELLVKVKPHQQ